MGGSACDPHDKKAIIPSPNKYRASSVKTMANLKILKMGSLEKISLAKSENKRFLPSSDYHHELPTDYSSIDRSAQLLYCIDVISD